MKKLIILCLLAALAVFPVSAQGKTKTLVAYFTFPIDNGKEALDANSGASVAIRDGHHYGNAQFIAASIAEKTKADLFEIDTGSHYPRDYKKIFDVTHDEQREDIKPELLQKVQDIDQYKNIVICTPVWWYRMPLAVKSFLDEYDLNGKTIYLAVTHGGSRSSGIEREITKAEPMATVSKDILVINRSITANSDKMIADWVNKVNLE